jgi:hypothetical protein
MTLDFGQRDLRGTELHSAVEEHFRRLHEPAFGRPSAAADPDARPDGAAIAFTGTVFTELAGHGAGRVCVAKDGTVTILTGGAAVSAVRTGRIPAGLPLRLRPGR